MSVLRFVWFVWVVCPVPGGVPSCLWCAGPRAYSLHMVHIVHIVHMVHTVHTAPMVCPAAYGVPPPASLLGACGMP